MAASRTGPFILGVAGGTASGKTSVCLEIMRRLGQDGVTPTDRKVALISLDSFYKVLTPEESKAAYAGEYNFDRPDAFDFDLVLETLRAVRRGEPVQIPIYDYKTHSRLPQTEAVGRPDVLMLEGILVLLDSRVRELLDLMIFVDEDADVRLSRRAIRDVQERGRDIKYVLRQYINHVKPAFDDYIFPSKRYAHIIIPRGRENQGLTQFLAKESVAIDLIANHIQDILASCEQPAAEAPAAPAESAALPAAGQASPATPFAKPPLLKMPSATLTEELGRTTDFREIAS